MNIPNTLRDQITEDFFLHDKILVVYFSSTVFDAVEKTKDGDLNTGTGE